MFDEVLKLLVINDFWLNFSLLLNEDKSALRA